MSNMVTDSVMTGSRPGILNNILETLGNTPLVKLNSVNQGLAPTIAVKVEFFNPGGSVKDRIGLAIIEDAERKGQLKPGGTIVESTSGNTGVGLAIVAAIKGYKTIFVMPDKMSEEKVRLLRAFGSRVIITPTAVEPDDPRSYYSVARRVVAETPNSILANQYHNPVNPQVHYETTGPEIWEQTGGKIDVFVAGMGTGGTISGVGHYLKEKNPDVQIVGIDPIGSILHDLFYTGKHDPAESYRVEGIGEDFLPSTTDFSVVDDIVKVEDRECFIMTRRLVREEGLFVGGSCGAVVVGALKYVRMKELGPNKTVVILLPDSGSRYLSKIFNDDWMREMGYFNQDWCEASASDVLGTKANKAVIGVKSSDTVNEVISKMKQYGISQAPVMHNGGVVGIVREIDLLQHMATSGHIHTQQETIADMIQTNFISAHAGTSLETLMNLFMESRDVVMVMDEQDHSQLVGILSKIDVLDYVVNHCI